MPEKRTRYVNDYTGRCQICQVENELRHLPIYVIGSEGVDVCHGCDLTVEGQTITRYWGVNEERWMEKRQIRYGDQND